MYKSPLTKSLTAAYPTGIPASEIERVVEIIHHYEVAVLSLGPAPTPRPAFVPPPKPPAPTAPKTAAGAKPRGRPPGAKNKKPPAAARPGSASKEMVDRARELLSKEPMLVRDLEEQLGSEAKGLGYSVIALAGARPQGEYEGDDGSTFTLFGLPQAGESTRGAH